MAEIMNTQQTISTQITLADHCQDCIANMHKDIDRAIAGVRRWRWRNAYKCGRCCTVSWMT